MSVTFISTLALIMMYVHLMTHDDLYPECIQHFNWDSFKDWFVYI